MLSAGATSYTYDRNGNELSAGATTFAYDLASRMNSTVLGSTTTTYMYDGDGVRTQTPTGTAASAKTNFLWDVNNSLLMLARERDRVVGVGPVCDSRLTPFIAHTCFN